MVHNNMRPIHPGEVLREEFMLPLGLSANSLARALGVTAARINDIARQRRGITADTALRLARYFRTDPQSWLNLQTVYDLRIAEIAASKTIQRRVKPRAAGLPYARSVVRYEEPHGPRRARRRACPRRFRTPWASPTSPRAN